MSAHFFWLVRSVTAIIVAITAPQQRRAFTVVTLEVFRWACCVAIIHLTRNTFSLSFRQNNIITSLLVKAEVIYFIKININVVGTSSEPSAQSTSPSQRHSDLMQNLGLVHWNSCSLHVVLQLISSLRSSQLNSPLQRSEPRMQRPSPHRNSDSLQLRGVHPKIDNYIMTMN